MPPTNSAFYENLPRVEDFAQLADASAFSPIPDDWLICCTDIVDSTGLIAQGQFKTVNMISAAVIAAVLNALSGQAFPYVFAGDGASFAVPRECEHLARDTLARLRSWVDREFAISLRAAMLPVKWIREEGFDVSVARYGVAATADYAMFSGGGLSWAEQQMKAGGYEVPPASDAISPDLTGLSCRWNTIKAHNGTILSLLILPNDTARDDEFAALAAKVLALSAQLDRNGHPVPPNGPSVGLPLVGFASESRLTRGTAPAPLRALALFAQTVFLWLVFSFKLPIRGFDPQRYRRVLSRNADFRKFDDGLKMTLDCDAAVRDQLRSLLEQAQSAGIIRFGWHEQDEAVVTCIVPSAFRDDHVHFVDGAAGGYAQAAQTIK